MCIYKPLTICEHPCFPDTAWFTNAYFSLQKDILCSLSDVSYNFKQSHEHKGYAWMWPHCVTSVQCQSYVDYYPLVVVHLQIKPRQESVKNPQINAGVFTNGERFVTACSLVCK